MKSKTHVPTRRRAPPDVVVTEADDGKEVTLHGNQKLVVRLSEQGGLPAIWWVLWSEDSNVNLTKQQPKPVIKPPPGASSSHPMVGGSVDRNFVFVPRKSTESFGIPLALIYSTPQFDLKDPDIKIFKVRVTTQKK